MTQHSPTGTARRFNRRELELVTAVAIAVVCVGYVIAAPQPTAEMIDHRLYRFVLDGMKSGEGYYSAMTAALDGLYGTERAELTQNVRAYRMPTIFVLLSFVPNEQWIWGLFVAVVGLAGIGASRLAARPYLGVLVFGYLLSIGMLVEGGVRNAQFLTTELWAVPVLLWSVAMAIRERWWPAALLALFAVLIRETAAPLLMAGVVMAVVGRLPWKPWLTAGIAAVAAYAAHAATVLKWIDRDVGTSIAQEPSSPQVILDIVEFGLPAATVLGLTLWLLAVAHVWKQNRARSLLIAPLLLPFAGLLIDREYWGILVVPFTIVWGVDQILDVLTRLKVGRAVTSR
ncbi:MAG: hypothetical protein WD532_08100 [Acidimicrobiia bacterium]